jgi:hypothetical protein
MQRFPWLWVGIIAAASILLLFGLVLSIGVDIANRAAFELHLLPRLVAELHANNVKATPQTMSAWSRMEPRGQLDTSHCDVYSSGTRIVVLQTNNAYPQGMIVYDYSNNTGQMYLIRPFTTHPLLLMRSRFSSD